MAQTVAPRPRTAPDPAGLPLAPPTRRRRRWSLAAVGALVTIGSALVFAVLWMNAGDRVPILAVAERVPAGQVIEADDLRVVRVSTDPGLAPIDGDRLDEVVGLVAATDLVPGTLLTTEHLGEGDLLEAGTAVVGLSLRPGQLPDGLRPGDRVQLVRAIPFDPDDPRGSLAFVLGEGRVFEIGDRDLTNGTVVVSVVVDDDIAPEVAGASHAELLDLALVPAS